MSITERLKECTTRIGTMCGDGRPPKMSIPVRDDDDDIFITTTCLQAAQEITELRAALAERDAEIERGKNIVRADLRELDARARLLFANEIKLAAQRKVLEQALAELIECRSSDDNERGRLAAITAIQGVLK